MDAIATQTSTFLANGTTCSIIMPAGVNHNLEIGQKVFIDFSNYSSGSVPLDDIFEVQDTVAFTATTFDITVPNVGGSNITGTSTLSLPVDFCFYLVNTGTVTNVNQFFPLFVQSVPQVSTSQLTSLTLEETLPLINHPTVQAGNNFGSANNEIAPKQRGLMLRRGQALYVAASGTSALTNGFYCNIQGGFY